MSTNAAVQTKRHSEWDVRVHGTYIYDHRQSWEFVKDLTWQEAAALVGIDPSTVLESTRKCNWCEGTGKNATATNPCHHCDGGQLKNGVSLWLNKGYIVLELPREEGLKDIQMAFVEQIGGHHGGVKPGMRAVYLHDGQYRLLVCKEPTKAADHG